ncbi:16S rRNA (adenine(1518)-N(6)/adenine(1519)-N(6))-dimethyltransferase RsmA [Helicobacter suis]|uniref:16S rRNA (adenine(1518)-N(6)/adenine(1519)-N(6))- dimethyltransferase RsmA n=1 Tax=Helicobacter suis TaxID=104628 RepID=UPI0013D42402|nr:16S rRNA (adenine(1518)-N(6)/adenine(1519)-N(6))-dimethyltransferase RsmA [Helicobacter suis]
MAVLGQHFLHDAHYLEQILQSIPYEHFKDRIQLVEIGVGLGDLTTRLLNKLESPKSLLAYEVDPDLAQRLYHKLGPLSERLELVVGDVMQYKGINGADRQVCIQTADRDIRLSVSETGFLCQKPYFLVSNLPYYIATPIITRALRDALCIGMAVMVQLEVADKFCAPAHSSDYGALSVLADSLCWQRHLLFKVNKEAFNPPPKVQSAFMSLLKKPLVERETKEWNLKSLEHLLKICFKANRKTLYNNLKGNYPLERIQDFYTAHNLEFALRPHQLDPAHYASLLAFLHNPIQ